MSKKTKNGKCVYCLQDTDNITKDHIPPKGITPFEYRKDLLTVPACFKCNNRLSLDDEYFRVVILINESVSEQKHLLELGKKTLGRFNHPTPFWDKFLFNVQKVDLYSKEEKYLGSKLQYIVDYNRIADFFIRIARGLYYIDTKNYIPTDYDVTSIDVFDKLDEKQTYLLAVFYEAIKDLAFKNRTDIIKFRYRVYPENHKLHSVWNIVIYDRLNFIVHFSKKNITSRFTTNVYDYITKGV